ncbi:hypothetical protein POTOM_038161 [Populus tomentosa]|uniref:Choline/ethanolaminephosphotransferase 1 n=1 Tax=Populus tomentosa TaxID=118781 RepID=A0A8X8CKT1_POPTO|nr:hypothetical protein POTOM_038161 [Populus tomentosa]
MGYIGSHGIAALHRYKYSGVDHSYVAKYVLQPFWSRCVNFFPLWMPPNMITLMGFMFLVTSALLGYIYSPRLDTPPPRWVHFAHGLLLFLYQTFDAVDGKQARRTNSSSPLGELFDHGCDALACAFESLAFGSTAMCGRDSFWFWLISAVPFYGATWEHFFTNTLILPAVNGPTEGLMLIYVAHLFTALVGAEWWVQHFGMSFPFLSWVPFVSVVTHIFVYPLCFLSFDFRNPNLQSRADFNDSFCCYTHSGIQGWVFFAVADVLDFASMGSFVPNGSSEWFIIDFLRGPMLAKIAAVCVSNVYKVVQARKSSMLLALAMLYPFLVLVGGVLVWDYLSPSDLMANYPHLVVLGTGLAFGFLVMHLPFIAVMCTFEVDLAHYQGSYKWVLGSWDLLYSFACAAVVEGRMILSHLCDEPKGLKTNMCLSLLYLPFAIANALAARLNDGVALVDEFWVLLGYCVFTSMFCFELACYSICTSPHLSSMKLQQLWEYAASGENLDVHRIVHVKSCLVQGLVYWVILAFDSPKSDECAQVVTDQSDCDLPVASMVLFIGSVCSLQSGYLVALTTKLILKSGNSGAVGQTIWNVIFGSTLMMNTVVTGSSGTGSGSTSVTNYFIYVTIELGDLRNARFF